MCTSYPLLKPKPCPTQKMEVGAVTGLYLVLLSVTLNGLPVSSSALVLCFTEDKGCSQLVQVARAGALTLTTGCHLQSSLKQQASLETSLSSDTDLITDLTASFTD